MLYIEVPLENEKWDENKQEFIEPKKQILQLEHSLVSLSKWESKWCKPFLSSSKTDEEILDYIKCMTITQNVSPVVYNYLTDSNIQEIVDYINAPMTAATFYNRQNTKINREIVTADLIYYWMITAQIPFEAEKWHINRLFTLIRICDIKNNSGNNKMSKKDIYAYNRQLNAARRAKLGSKG